MKLSKITFNNFRVFEKDTFDFKPLTVLTGSNSSGKSTIVKALILLQENLKPSNYLGRLTFKDGFHNLGNFQSILTKESSGKTITFDIEWENINHKKNHKKRDLFEGIQFINVVREYEQDSIQEQNGILKRFELNINENENIIRCYKNDDKFEIEINHAWFIDKILENGLFKFNPQLYKIWDKIKVEEINIALEEWRGRFDIDENRALNNIDTKLEDNEEYVQLKESLSKLEIEDDANTKKNTEIRNKVRVLRTEIRAIEKDYTQRIGEIQKKINELDKKSEDEKGDEEQEQRTNYYSQIDILESNKDEGVSNIESQIENIKLGYEVSDEDRELFEEQQRIENQLQDIKDQEKINLENEYERLRENIRESKLRTFLYEQLKVASESFLINLREIELNPTVPNLGVNTIADYLVNNQWGNKIYELTENEESKLVEELISWNEETSFIESVILEDRRSEKDKKEDDEKGIYQYEGIKFHQIIGQGDNNQLAKLLIEKISELINQFTRELPFTHLSAMRGFQQRVYKTSQPKYHLEDALSKLLGMQHKNSKDKLDFINEWIYYFGISDNEENKLIAEIIEGDYVRGFIESGSKKERINIADFGLGISQLLPIIIYTADAIDTDLLICIEEPGTHLHPNLQAKLVEFMLSVNRKYNLQFLIETHSETFIRKLQYEIVHNKANKLEGIIIRYMNIPNTENQKIGINEYGELVDLDTHETIDSFGEGFLDEGTRWVNLQKALKEVKKGKIVIACEGNNERAFNWLKLPNCIFYGKNGLSSQNSKGVYITVKKEPNIIGIRDRDFLTDYEINSLCTLYPNYKILDYYSYESYLYHPDNIEELVNLKNMEFDKEQYINEIKNQKSASYEDIIMGIRTSRSTYEELKDGKLLEKNKKERSKREATIQESLKSNEFSHFYKFFDMKRTFDRTCIDHYQFKEEDFYSTTWFKQQIADILRIKL
jgi:predicted ATPase